MTFAGSASVSLLLGGGSGGDENRADLDLFRLLALDRGDLGLEGRQMRLIWEILDVSIGADDDGSDCFQPLFQALPAMPRLFWSFMGAGGFCTLRRHPTTTAQYAVGIAGSTLLGGGGPALLSFRLDWETQSTQRWPARWVDEYPWADAALTHIANYGPNPLELSAAFRERWASMPPDTVGIVYQSAPAVAGPWALGGFFVTTGSRADRILQAAVAQVVADSRTVDVPVAPGTVVGASPLLRCSATPPLGLTSNRVYGSAPPSSIAAAAGATTLEFPLGTSVDVALRVSRGIVAVPPITYPGGLARLLAEPALAPALGASYLENAQGGARSLTFYGAAYTLGGASRTQAVWGAGCLRDLALSVARSNQLFVSAADQSRRSCQLSLQVSLS